MKGEFLLYFLTLIMLVRMMRGYVMNKTFPIGAFLLYLIVILIVLVRMIWGDGGANVPTALGN